jgi:PAS domain S-box-containing protein
MNNNGSADVEIKEPTSLRSFPRQIQVALLGFSALGYLLFFSLLFQHIGLSAINLVLLPVALIGWLWGFRAGIIAGLLALPLNSLLLHLAGVPGSDLFLRLPGLTVQAAAVCLGAVSGWMHNQHEALQLTLAQYRRAQESLRESERHHRQMFDKNRAVQMLIELGDGRIVDANSAAAGFYGYSLAQLKQMTLTAITQAEPELLAQELARAATEEQSYFIFTHLLASGEVRQVELYCGPVHIHGRRLLYAIIHDITERQQAQEALKESERQYRMLIEQSNDAIYILYNNRFELINKRFSELFGVSAEEVRSPGFDFMELVAPESMPVIEERRQRIRRGEAVPPRYEFTACAHNGRLVPLEVTVSYVDYRGGTASQGILRDITARKKAEEALRRSEQHFRSLIENALDIIIIVDERGTVLFASPSIERVLGYSPEELMGRSGFDLAHPDDLAVLMQKYGDRMHQPGATTSIQFRCRHKDQSWRILEANSKNLLYDPVVTGVVINSRDVTERRQAEESLQRRTAELEALVKVSADLRAARSLEEMMPVVLENAVNLVAGINGSLYLVEPESGDLVARAGHPLNNRLLGRRFKPGQGITGHVALAGEIHISENLIQDPLAHILPQEEVYLPLTGGHVSLPLRAQERIVGVLNVSFPESRLLNQDEIRLLTAISEIAGSGLDRAMVLETLEQRVEERTRELAEANRRLTELDQLKSKFVSDVSHELRTPVANLSLYVDLMERGKPEKQAAYLSVLRDQTDRLVHLITDVLNLAQLEFAEPRAAFEAVDLNSLLEQLVSAHRLQAESAGLALCFSPLPGLPPVRGDRHQLSQIITNLLTNAINYSQSGEIRVETCLAGNGQHAGQRACFSVGDDGIGIDAADIPHLFDRFYRGRGTSQSNIPGTGLGLAIVKEIVDQHGGEVQIESAMGAGATFRIYLPVTTDGSFAE